MEKIVYGYRVSHSRSKNDTANLIFKMASPHDATHPSGVCFCQVCRDIKLQTYRNVEAAVLKYMLRKVFPLRIEVTLKKMHRQTLEYVVVAKACKTAILQNSQYKYLKL